MAECPKLMVATVKCYTSNLNTKRTCMHEFTVFDDEILQEVGTNWILETIQKFVGSDWEILPDTLKIIDTSQL